MDTRIRNLSKTQMAGEARQISCKWCFRGANTVNGTVIDYGLGPWEICNSCDAYYHENCARHAGVCCGRSCPSRPGRMVVERLKPADVRFHELALLGNRSVTEGHHVAGQLLPLRIEIDLREFEDSNRVTILKLTNVSDQELTIPTRDQRSVAPASACRATVEGEGRHTRR
jgi:hypothetical protein